MKHILPDFASASTALTAVPFFVALAISPTTSSALDRTIRAGEIDDHHSFTWDGWPREDYRAYLIYPERGQLMLEIQEKDDTSNPDQYFGPLIADKNPQDTVNIEGGSCGTGITCPTQGPGYNTSTKSDYKHRVVFWVDFFENGEEKQRFDGYLVSDGKGGQTLAGITWWRGFPFAFGSPRRDVGSDKHRVRIDRGEYGQTQVTAEDYLCPGNQVARYKMSLYGSTVDLHFFRAESGEKSYIQDPEPAGKRYTIRFDESGKLVDPIPRNQQDVVDDRKGPGYREGVDWDYRHRLVFWVDFNQNNETTKNLRDDQRFDGYIFTQTEDGFAGITWNDGVPAPFHADFERCG